MKGRMFPICGFQRAQRADFLNSVNSSLLLGGFRISQLRGFITFMFATKRGRTVFQENVTILLGWVLGGVLFVPIFVLDTGCGAVSAHYA